MMNIVRLLYVIIVCCLSLNAYAEGNSKSINSGVSWFDQNNNEVNAHGGCIVKEGDKYYLFGEYKSDTANLFSGFSCYSSLDLVNWKFENIVLPMQKEGLLGPNRIGERVKVMKCPQTGEFVMYMHTDDSKYKDPHVGYATSDTIDGDYVFHGPVLYEGKPIRKWDIGTFQDTDGKGYLLIHHGIIYELASDYKTIKRLVVSRQKSGESPAMFKSNGVYFWLSSNLTSWERNDNYYLTATSLEGPWTRKGFFAPEGTLTWNSQCSFVFPVSNGQDTIFMYMGDRWSYPKQGSAATYVWQPISVDGPNMSIPDYVESWQIDFSNFKWNAVHSEKKIIKPASIQGNWHRRTGAIASNERGAIAAYKFNGGRIGFNALSNTTSGYAKVIITNSENEEFVNTIVDFYSKYECISQKFISPKMEKDVYKMTIEVQGEHGQWSDKKKNQYGSVDDYVYIVDVFVVDEMLSDVSGDNNNPVLKGY